MERRKNVNPVLIVIIVLLVCAVGYLGYNVYTLNNTVNSLMEKENTNINNNTPINNNTNTNDNTSDEENVTYKEIKSVDDEKPYLKYEALVVSGYGYINDNGELPEIDTVFKKEKSTGTDLSDAQKLLGVIGYTLFSENTFEKRAFNANELKKVVEQIYGSPVKSLPKYLMGKGKQSVDFELINGKYDNSSSSGSETYGLHENNSIFIDKVGTNGTKLYIIQKTIVNESPLTAMDDGTISKIDGSDKIEVKNFYAEDPRDLYKKYFEYYSTFKHTFDISNGTVKYISTELVD